MSGLKPKSFYGQKQTTRDLRRKRHLSEAEERVVKKRASDILSLSNQKNILHNVPKVYKVFPKQSDAIRFIEPFAGALHAFAFETDTSGRRSYIACHPERYWLMYSAKEPSERHSYEVIIEGATCKLYLDLEYKKKLNPDTDGEGLLEKFKVFLVKDVKETFEVNLSESQILDLDSSTDEKFSRHLIVDLVFKDNYQVGNYVRSFCSKLEGDTLMLVKLSEKENNNGLFVDKGVYTKNRNFRLFLSSKFGKSAILKCSNSDKTDKEIFLSSLVSFCPNVPSEKIVQFGESCLSFTPTSRMSSSSLENVSKSGPSPFPEVDNFVNELVSPSGGYIRKWLLGGSSVSSLVYEISGGYRFCENISRNHKSNNIRLIVDLNFGVYHQTCHDPDCRGFMSTPRILPPDAMPWLLIDDDPAEDWNSTKSSEIKTTNENRSNEMLPKIDNCSKSDDRSVLRERNEMSKTHNSEKEEFIFDDE